MKLIVKSDDYGFTKGVTAGIYDGIVNGIITCTGLFANMPEAEKAVELVKDRPRLSLGIDINIVSGPSVSDPSRIPTLIDHETGEFVRSTARYDDPGYDKNGPNEEFWPFEECYTETCAQIERFIELAGRKPAYLNGHSISKNAPGYQRALNEASKTYDIPLSNDIFEKFNVFKLPNITQKPFPVEAQMVADREGTALEMLEKYKDKEYVHIGGHCGFVDDDLLKYSTFTIIRAKDHKMMTSERIKQWIKDNNVELISFNELLNE